MTKPGYTHLLISIFLHSGLKEKDRGQEISIDRYIQKPIENEGTTAHNRAATGLNPVRPIFTLKPL
jgi:hypothetical protein